MVASGKIVLHMRVLDSGEMQVVHGPLIEAWVLLLFGYILLSLTFLGLGYARTDRENRERIWIVLAGMCVFVAQP